MESELLNNQNIARADCTEFLARATEKAASELPMDARTAFTRLLETTSAMLDNPVERQVIRDAAVNCIENLFGPDRPGDIMDQNELREGIFEYFGATLAEKLLQKGPEQGASMREFVDRVEQDVQDRLDTIQDEVQAADESDGQAGG